MSPTTRSKDHGKSEKVENAETGSKHKMTDTEGPENPKPAPKKQKTIEETIDKGTDYMGNNKSKVKEEDKGTELKTRRSGSGKDKQHEDPKEKPEPKKSKSKAKAQKDEPKSDPAPDDQQEEEGFTSRTNSKSKAQPEKKQTPQTGTGKSTAQILERGIIYFFLRGRVNTDTPSSVSEIARTYFLLRPMTPSSPPSNLPSSLANKCRVLVVPKKTFPTSGRERWISFVEKVGASFADLKDSFLGGNDYETKTRGTQHTPAAKPEGEGVYMITNTGRDSHLSYVLTRPRPVEEVQRKLGLMEHGTFVLSTRNPEFKSPGNARLPEGPEFPEEIKKDFNGLRWTATKPSHLDIEAAQILLVGESQARLEKYVGYRPREAEGKDQEKGEVELQDELDELAEEDEKRMNDLADGDASAIYADIHADAEDYPDVQTTF